MNQTEKKKKAILDVTFALLNEKKINEITVEEIAEKAVVSKVTLFKYFGNKNHLMNLVIRQSLESIANDAHEISKSDLDFEATYRAIAQMKIHQLHHFSPVFSSNLMKQYASSPDFFDTDAQAQQMKIYKELLRKGHAEGKINRQLTENDLIFILHLLSEGMKAFSPEQLFEKTELLIQFFINGLK